MGRRLIARVLDFIVWIAVAAIVLSVLCAPARALCTPAELTKLLLENDPRIVSAEMLEDDRLRVAGEFYNAAPPESDVPVNTALLAEFNDGSGVLFVGDAGMLCGQALLAPEGLTGLKAMLDGQRS
jgi:hypothetical protein